MKISFKNRRFLLPTILSDVLEEESRMENNFWHGLCPDDEYYPTDWWNYDEFGNYIGEAGYVGDDDFDDDDYVFPLNLTKGGNKSKSGKHGSRGKSKAKTIHKRKAPIHFYSDYNNDMDVVEFDSVSEFEVFCAEEGIYVDDYAVAAIASNNEIYCCIDPRWLDYGYKYLYCDFNYSNMYYEVCKPEEL